MKGLRRVLLIGMVAVVMVAVFLGVSAIANKSHATAIAQKTGVALYQNSKAQVDASNLSEGYLLIKYTGGLNVRTRLQIIKTNGSTYTYDINNKGTVETYPLTEGNGKYSIKVYENTSGTKYALAYSCSVDLKLRDEFLPYLYPNQFVNYQKTSKVVSVAADLTKEKQTDLEKLESVYDYVVQNFSYDYTLAKTVKSGYIPNLDQVFKKKSGICFDYASVMAAMLRSQDIPCKLVIGYAGDVYHAWINVYIEGEGWIDNAIFFDGQNWSLMDPTFVSSAKKSSSVMKFVTNQSNYKEKFAY